MAVDDLKPAPEPTTRHKQVRELFEVVARKVYSRLKAKNDRYARRNIFDNFDTGAKLMGVTPFEYLMFLCAKHVARLFGMDYSCDAWKEEIDDLMEETVIDIITYMILLYGLFARERHKTSCEEDTGC